MNKFVIYALLILSYLTLSKSFSPNEFGVKYIKENKDLLPLVPGSPVSLILMDIHSTGFIIKTYYHKYKIIYGFQSFEELIVRTSKKFSEANTPFIGMSVFRRNTEEGVENFTPLPPGSIFIGNKNFGNWFGKGGPNRRWRFFRVYKQFPEYFGWEDFVPTFTTHEIINRSMELEKPFFGSNDEFGLNGKITQKAFPQYFERSRPKDLNIKEFLSNYFKENFIKTDNL